MASRLLNNVAIVVCVIILASGCLGLNPTATALKCYQCLNQQSNFMCMNEDKLKECTRPGMDTCQTIVNFSEISRKLSITKTCTLKTACQSQINATHLTTPCDTSRASWVCTTCCYSDACNVNVAMTTRELHVTTLLATFAVSVFMSRLPT